MTQDHQNSQTTDSVNDTFVPGNPTGQRNTEEMEQALEFLTRPLKQQMRIEIFSRDFLPFFDLRGMEPEIAKQMLADMSAATGIRCTEKDLVHNLINRWLTAVNSVYLETDVIDNENNIVYTVPALLRSHDDVIAIDGTQLSQLVETASNHYNVHPNEGTRFFQERIIPHIIRHQLTTEEKRKWNIIFDYHNFPRYSIEGEEDPQPQLAETAPTIDPDSECDYELD